MDCIITFTSVVIEDLTFEKANIFFLLMGPRPKLYQSIQLMIFGYHFKKLFKGLVKVFRKGLLYLFLLVLTSKLLSGKENFYDS